MHRSQSRKLKGLYKFYTSCVLIGSIIVYSSFRGETGDILLENNVKSSIRNSIPSANSDYENGHKHISRSLLQDGAADVECRHVHKIKGEDKKCEFVQNTSSCASDGFIAYNNFIYCDLRQAVWAGMIILVMWWLFCFVGLAVTADDFFCPSLVVISSTLKLSPNVAGVTFLAFGNGAPDLFSALAALSNTTDGDAELGVGGLLGAGMFVTSVVTGTIAIITPFKARERPFLRDVIFYIFGVFWTFLTLWRGKITLGESIGFICFYVIYVVVVVVSHSIYKRQKKKAQGQSLIVPENSPNEYDDATENAPVFMINAAETPAHLDHSGTSAVAFNNNNTSVPSQTASSDQLIDDRLKTKQQDSTTSSDTDLYENTEEPRIGRKSPIKQFLQAVNPIDTAEWKEMGIFRKFYEIFKSPLIFILLLTCPVVSYEVEETHNWNKYLQCVQCLISPLVISIITGFGFNKLGNVFPLWALMIIIGIPLCLLVYFTSVDIEKPKYHWVFGYAGFIISMLWIYIIADVIVNILQTFGIVFNISDAILGLTLLAWGNSIGDWIADTVMARQGFARMGFAACFGAPFFNLMLGFGLPMLITMAKNGETQVKLTITPVQLILTSFLLGNLCFNFVFVNSNRFKVNRVYGIIEVCFYLLFLTLALLTESGVIFSDWVQTRKCVVDCA